MIDMKLIKADEDVPRNTDTVYIWYKEKEVVDVKADIDIVLHHYIYAGKSGEGFFEDGQWHLYHEKDNGSWQWEAIDNETVFAWMPTVWEGSLRKEFEAFTDGKVE